MVASNLLELLRARPFIPFRLVASDGRTHEIRHPDRALVLRTRVILPMTTGENIPEASEHLALAHILRFEEVPAAAT